MKAHSEIQIYVSFINFLYCGSPTSTGAIVLKDSVFPADNQGSLKVRGAKT